MPQPTHRAPIKFLTNNILTATFMRLIFLYCYALEREVFLFFYRFFRARVLESSRGKVRRRDAYRADQYTEPKRPFPPRRATPHDSTPQTPLVLDSLHHHSFPPRHAIQPRHSPPCITGPATLPSRPGPCL